MKVNKVVDQWVDEWTVGSAGLAFLRLNGVRTDRLPSLPAPYTYSPV